MTEVEICVADAEGAGAAAQGGADRVELCVGLEVGGLTPSTGTVEETRELVGDLFVTVLIRPRAGDFVYGPIEARTMLRDVAGLAGWADRVGWGRLGFTIGALTPSGDVDAALVARLRDAAGGRLLVFNKAFDAVVDRAGALAQLGELGVESVLTSGGGGACTDNLAELRRLAAGGPVAVVAAGGVRPHNVVAIAATGVPRVHLRAPRQVPSASVVASEYDQGTRETTSAETVAEVVRLLAGEHR